MVGTQKREEEGKRNWDSREGGVRQPGKYNLEGGGPSSVTIESKATLPKNKLNDGKEGLVGKKGEEGTRRTYRLKD